MKSTQKITSGPALVVFGVIAVVALLALSGRSVPSASPSTDLGETYGTPVMNIPVSKVELGDVSMRDGIAEHVFAIKNDGDGPLRIGGLETSCMCTKSQLEVAGEKSPKFGMSGHGGPNPNTWAMDIPEGSEGKLRVYYDPNAHGPGGVGPFTRTISFTTNDPVTPSTSVRIAGITVR